MKRSHILNIGVLLATTQNIHMYFIETFAFYLKCLVIVRRKIVTSPEGALVAINYQNCNLNVIIRQFYALDLFPKALKLNNLTRIMTFI
jgi:hypothetical protein